jgi:hypothetical protein
MEFSTYPISPCIHFVENQYGRLPLICISLFPLLSKLTKLQRTLVVILCTILWRTSLYRFSIMFCRAPYIRFFQELSSGRNARLRYNPGTVASTGVPRAHSHRVAVLSAETKHANQKDAILVNCYTRATECARTQTQRKLRWVSMTKLFLSVPPPPIIWAPLHLH